MKQKLNLIFCASGHLPSGAGEMEFENLYNTEIKPLVSALDKFPRINMVFHYSGVIFNWIERKHPEFFMLVDDLLSRKQAEFLGGGFYEPILPLLPQADKIGQIEMLTTYLRKHFGKRPQGCWLPAMAWEQNLVGPLSSCGMNYTFLDDSQFSGAGLTPAEGGIFSPCITEDQGKIITVFPVSASIGRELWKDKPLKTLADKFPHDREYPVMVFPVPVVSEYEKFFEELSGADSNIEFTFPGKVFKNLKRLEKVYFPGTWVMGFNTETKTHPRQFLVDHPEAGGIYSKMVYVNTLINNQLRGDKARKRTALEKLWKAQDSSIFSLRNNSSPGLFHSQVRKAAYRTLLEAEKITREKGKFSPSLSIFDFDLDGEGEFIFQGDMLNCYIKSRGAGIFELDYLPVTWNYLDTLAPFYGNIKTNKKRCAFVDWLAPAATSANDAGPEGIRGGRFCGIEEYEVSEIDRVRQRLGFTLPSKANIPFGEIEIKKTWQLKQNCLSLEYLLKNTGLKSQKFIFSSAIDLSFPGEKYIKILTPRETEKENITLNDAATVKDIRFLELQDLKNEVIIFFESSCSFDGRIFHVRYGPPGESAYQSTCIMPLLPVSLEAGKTWKANLSLRISS